MKKFTTTEFTKRFPNDDACLHHLFELRFGNMAECPECSAKADFKKVKGRKSYNCSSCAYQVYPMANTIFEKSTTPLLYWFWAIYMFTTTRNGVAAKELERQFNICYKTALRMAHQIKKLISNRTEMVMTGIVEADETVFGQKARNLHKSERAKYTTKDSHAVRKTIVFGMVERGGEIITQVIEKADAQNIVPIVNEKVSSQAIFISDGARAYHSLDPSNFNLYSVNHEQNEWVRGILHTNTIEGFWSQVKRTILGTHIHVSKKHLQKYLNECAFRYKMRDNQDKMFDTILSHVVPSV
jgi:transposase